MRVPGSELEFLFLGQGSVWLYDYTVYGLKGNKRPWYKLGGIILEEKKSRFDADITAYYWEPENIGTQYPLMKRKLKISLKRLAEINHCVGKKKQQLFLYYLDGLAKKVARHQGEQDILELDEPKRVD